MWVTQGVHDREKDEERRGGEQTMVSYYDFDEQQALARWHCSGVRCDSGVPWRSWKQNCLEEMRKQPRIVVRGEGNKKKKKKEKEWELEKGEESRMRKRGQES